MSGHALGAESRRQPIPDSQTLVGLLADRDRRLVVAGMLLGAAEPGDISGQVGLGPREVMRALDRLVAGGLVERLNVAGDGDRFHLLEQAFEFAFRSGTVKETEESVPSLYDDQPDEARRVLERALPDGRLTSLPTKHSKRLIVLDYLAQRFEPGIRYSERQVNSMLRPVDEDVATLRRWLIDTSMLDRAEGQYWRSGASFLTG